MGIPGPFPYLSEQSIGGWLAIFIMAVIVTRRHLANVWRTIWGQDSGIDESKEPINYRSALLLIICAGLYILWFCLKAGMTVWIIIPYFLFFYALSVGITRVRAEIGPPAHEMAGMCNGQHFRTLVFPKKLTSHFASHQRFSYCFHPENPKDLKRDCCTLSL